MDPSGRRQYPSISLPRHPDNEAFEFTYPDWGDRIYYAESRDGLTWHLDGDDYTGPPDHFGPDAKRPMRILSPSETAQERNHLGNPSVLKVEGVYYLYYEAPCEYALARGADGKPRGSIYGERLYPRFLTDPHGRILVQDGCVAIFYASGLGFKDKAYTWDLYRCDVEAHLLEQAR